MIWLLGATKLVIEPQGQRGDDFLYKVQGYDDGEICWAGLLTAEEIRDFLNEGLAS